MNDWSSPWSSNDTRSRTPSPAKTLQRNPLDNGASVKLNGLTPATSTFLQEYLDEAAWGAEEDVVLVQAQVSPQLVRGFPGVNNTDAHADSRPSRLQGDAGVIEDSVWNTSPVKETAQDVGKEDDLGGFFDAPIPAAKGGGNGAVVPELGGEGMETVDLLEGMGWNGDTVDGDVQLEVGEKSDEGKDRISTEAVGNGVVIHGGEEQATTVDLLGAMGWDGAEGDVREDHAPADGSLDVVIAAAMDSPVLSDMVTEHIAEADKVDLFDGLDDMKEAEASRSNEIIPDEANVHAGEDILETFEAAPATETVIGRSDDLEFLSFNHSRDIDAASHDIELLDLPQVEAKQDFHLELEPSTPNQVLFDGSVDNQSDEAVGESGGEKLAESDGMELQDEATAAQTVHDAVFGNFGNFEESFGLSEETTRANVGLRELAVEAPIPTLGAFRLGDDSVASNTESTEVPPTDGPKREIGSTVNLPFKVDQSLIDELFSPMKDNERPPPVSDSLIESTSTRKTWYRISRQSSIRYYNSSDFDNYVRVTWPSSATRKKVTKVVGKWIVDDRASGGSLFRPRFQQIATTAAVAKASAMTEAEVLESPFGTPAKARKPSVTAAGFGWSSLAAPVRSSSPIIAPPPSATPRPGVPRINTGSSMQQARAGSPALLQPPQAPGQRPTTPAVLQQQPPQEVSPSSPATNVVKEDDDDFGDFEDFVSSEPTEEAQPVKNDGTLPAGDILDTRQVFPTPSLASTPLREVPPTSSNEIFDDMLFEPKTVSVPFSESNANNPSIMEASKPLANDFDDFDDWFSAPNGNEPQNIAREETKIPTSDFTLPPPPIAPPTSSVISGDEAFTQSATHLTYTPLTEISSARIQETTTADTNGFDDPDGWFSTPQQSQTTSHEVLMPPGVEAPPIAASDIAKPPEVSEVVPSVVNEDVITTDDDEFDSWANAEPVPAPDGQDHQEDVSLSEPGVWTETVVAPQSTTQHAAMDEDEFDNWASASPVDTRAEPPLDSIDFVSAPDNGGFQHAVADPQFSTIPTEPDIAFPTQPMPEPPAQQSQTQPPAQQSDFTFPDLGDWFGAAPARPASQPSIPTQTALFQPPPVNTAISTISTKPSISFQAINATPPRPASAFAAAIAFKSPPPPRSSNLVHEFGNMEVFGDQFDVSLSPVLPSSQARKPTPPFAESTLRPSATCVNAAIQTPPQLTAPAQDEPNDFNDFDDDFGTFVTSPRIEQNASFNLTNAPHFATPVDDFGAWTVNDDDHITAEPGANTAPGSNDHFDGWVVNDNAAVVGVAESVSTPFEQSRQGLRENGAEPSSADFDAMFGGAGASTSAPFGVVKGGEVAARDNGLGLGINSADAKGKAKIVPAASKGEVDEEAVGRVVQGLPDWSYML